MFVRAKVAEREAAPALRAMGMPYKRIAAELGVSANSAYHWTRDIRLTPDQEQANLRGPNGPHNTDRVQRAAATWAARCRARRAAYQADGRAAAREHDPLHLAGCMLYWAEGAKRRNTIQFTNSDSRMLLYSGAS